MRTDPNKNAGFTESQDWKNQRYSHTMIYPDPTGQFKYRVNSFSGNEPNRFFLQHEGSFIDLSPVSGIDHLGDGRGFALLDYDKDGWQDIALISTNAPRLQIYRNTMGEMFVNNDALKIRLIGSQRNGEINPIRSNRNGIGSKIYVERKSGRRSMRQSQAGEGNVSQNSGWIWVAQPQDDPAVEIEVVWPSGRRSVAKVEVGKQQIVIEEPVTAGPVQ